MTTGFTGGCLCGGIRCKTTSGPQLGADCQCEDCRKSSGSGHCSHLVVAAEAMSIEGQPTRFDKPADSGNMVSRFFCGSCGAPVYSTNSGMPEIMFPRASSLDDPEIFTPSMIVYTSRAPSWDVVDAALPAFEGMPPDIPLEQG